MGATFMSFKETEKLPRVLYHTREKNAIVYQIHWISADMFYYTLFSYYSNPICLKILQNYVFF